MSYTRSQEEHVTRYAASRKWINNSAFALPFGSTFTVYEHDSSVRPRWSLDPALLNYPGAVIGIKGSPVMARPLPGLFSFRAHSKSFFQRALPYPEGSWPDHEIWFRTNATSTKICFPLSQCEYPQKLVGRKSLFRYGETIGTFGNGGKLVPLGLVLSDPLVKLDTTFRPDLQHARPVYYWFASKSRVDSYLRNREYYQQALALARNAQYAHIYRERIAELDVLIADMQKHSFMPPCLLRHQSYFRPMVVDSLLADYKEFLACQNFASET